MSATPVAVVGMALRVPGAGTPEKFWRNLLAAKDSLTRSTVSELRLSGVHRGQIGEKRLVHAKPLLDDIDYFDAQFFGMSAFEAARTSPSHRIFLEICWEAMENAAIRPSDGGTVTGVYGGVESRYQDQNLEDMHERWKSSGYEIHDFGAALPLSIGNAPEHFTARVSHRLNLTGPSFSVSAACATSLVAIHMAVQAIRRGECDVALAGGASIELPQHPAYLSSVEGLLSASGWLRPFDSRADGTIFGNGVGAVVLRPLADAIAAGNPVLAVVGGTATSNDGNPVGKESFIAPTARGQQKVIRDAMADADYANDSIGYLEAHGTATALGDPVEIDSITEIYGRTSKPPNYCALGSVKANVGHLRNAAGVVSFIKACLALKNRTLPPQANFVTANPAIDFENGPFVVNTEPREWINSAGQHRAAVSSFGFGGTNAHIVLEEYTPPAPQAVSRTRHLFTLSAKTQSALQRRIGDLASHWAQHPDLRVADIAHTLQSGRVAMQHRVSVEVESLAKPADLLAAPHYANPQVVNSERPLVFLFPGQGTQQPGMGQQIYEREAAYRNSVDASAEFLMDELGFDIRTLIHASTDEPAEEQARKLNQTVNTQPALFVVEYALAQLFLTWGARPAAVLGHSIGEIVAACVAGVLSHEDALKLVAARSRLMQTCERGAMAAVLLRESKLRDRLGDHVEIAAVNAPGVCVVSGPEDAIRKQMARMGREGIQATRLQTSHAFHSWMMEPALPEFRAVLDGIRFLQPQISVISNLTGVPLTTAQATDPAYWSDHLRHAVRFSSGVETILADGDPIFLELGPGRTLSGLVRQHDAKRETVTALEPEAKGEAEVNPALRALGQIWCNGAAINWDALYSGTTVRKEALPTYPFERQRYWLKMGELETDTEGNAFLYEPGYRKADLETDDLSDEPQTWLIFRDELGLGQTIGAALRSRDRYVVELIPGETFCEVEPGVFTICPGSSDDISKLLSMLSGLGGGERGRLAVLHLWSVTGPLGDHNSSTAFEHAVSLGYHTIIALLRASVEAGVVETLDVLLAADGIVQMPDEVVALHAEKGNLIGLARNIPSELPGVSLRCVDLAAGMNDGARDWLVEMLVAEARSVEKPAVSLLRTQGRFVEELYDLPTQALGRPRLRDGATVLVTGGLGALGLEVAGLFFEMVKARLVLTSRWEPPPREMWAEYAQSDDKIGRALSRIMKLENSGAEILIVKADVSDRESLQSAVAAADAHFGDIHAVVHCAAQNASGIAHLQSRAKADQIFSAKVHGAFNLEEIFADRALDVFVYFSSIVSRQRTDGQAIYSSSNAVVDLLAARRSNGANGLAVAIGYGPIEQIGMAIEFLGELDGRQRNTVDQESLGEARVVDHPLIRTRIQRRDGRVIYTGMFRDGDSWVFEHRLGSRALVAGAVILECVYAAFVDHKAADGRVTFRQTAFMRPLFAESSGTDVEIAFFLEEGVEQFEVRSRRSDQDDEWRTNVLGKIEAAPFDECVELPVIHPEAKDYMLTREYINTGERWNCVEWVKKDGLFTEGQLRLSDEFRPDLRKFRLHPALFDRGIRVTMDKTNKNETVPYAFEEMRVRGPLPQDIYIRGNRLQDTSSIVFNFSEMDADGNVLIDIKNLVMREVVGSGLEKTGSDHVEDFKDRGLIKHQRLEVVEPGDLASVQPRDFEPVPPQAGEVQIEVVAAGLNFRDVLAALGQLPTVGGIETIVGNECTGIVSTVGEGVTNLQPGDPVVALASESFSTSVTVPAEMATLVPANISMDDAAGIPIAFVTAEYAIGEIARLKEGERILIHAGAGGVGLAAIQLAQKLGAEVYATAGSERKRAYLHSLGVEHVGNSRSLDFVDSVREWTDGEGVDVVLNALAGEFIQAGLEVLRYRGRFLEIGKRDIYGDTQMGLYAFRNNLTYSAIDLGQMIRRHDSLVPDMLNAVMLRFGRGELKPTPTQVIPIKDVARGFQHMARAEHIGKIVFRIGRDPDLWREHFKRFQTQFGDGVPLQAALDVIRRAVRSNTTPAYILTAGAPISEIGERHVLLDAGQGGRPDLDVPYRPPSSIDEEVQVAVWQTALGISPIGIDDDFFELGGDSLSAIQIQFAVEKRCDVKLPMTAIVDSPTIARLAAFIKKQRP